MNEGDEFAFNEKFEDKGIHIHIGSIQQREMVRCLNSLNFLLPLIIPLFALSQPEEVVETTRHINADRAHLLDAAIVRSMKAKKKLTDEELKAETIHAVRAHFVPTVPAIKKQIESLHERDFLSRDENNIAVWHYVA